MAQARVHGVAGSATSAVARRVLHTRGCYSAAAYGLLCLGCCDSGGARGASLVTGLAFDDACAARLQVCVTTDASVEYVATAAGLCAHGREPVS